MLIADPDTDLPTEDVRALFMADMARIGDALQRATACERISFAILGGPDGNPDAPLHAHVFPRHADEPTPSRGLPPWLAAGEPRRFDPERDADLIRKIRAALDEPDDARDVA